MDDDAGSGDEMSEDAIALKDIMMRVGIDDFKAAIRKLMKSSQREKKHFVTVMGSRHRGVQNVADPDDTRKRRDRRLNCYRDIRANLYPQPDDDDELSYYHGSPGLRDDALAMRILVMLKSTRDSESDFP